MIIYRQKMYGAFPASWGKDLIERAKNSKKYNTFGTYFKEDFGGGGYPIEELRNFRKSLKTADPLVNRQKFINDIKESEKERVLRGAGPLDKKTIKQLRRTQMTGKEFNTNAFAYAKEARNATPINRNPEKWEKLVDKSREDNKNWRIEQARRDQEAKYQDAQKRIAKLDQQAQSQQKSKGGFVSHIFGR